MRKTQTRKIAFGLLLMVAFVALLVQPNTKGLADSKARVLKASGQETNAATGNDEVMTTRVPTSMTPAQLPKEPRPGTLRPSELEDQILSDIEPSRLRQLKDQARLQSFPMPTIELEGYSAQKDASTSPIDKLAVQPLAPGIFTNFEGPDNLSQTDGFLHGPPDGGIAAGPNHIMVSVNSLLAIYSKTGTQQLNTSLASWFSAICSVCKPYDPRLAYDAVAGRWLLLAVDGDKDTNNLSNYLLSVSKTSDPNGGWWLYSLNGALNYTPTGENTWADFPHLGFDGIASASGGAIYITSNQFTFGSSPAFRTATLSILSKSSLYSGASLNYWRAWGRANADGSQAFALSPAFTYGGASGEFLVNSKNGGNFVTLWKVVPTYPPTALNWTLQATINIGAYSLPPDASQPGSCALMATNDNRIGSSSVWRNGKFYAAFTEAHDWGGGGGNVAALRFLQINTSTNATEHNLTYGADGLYYSFPVLATDSSDNVVVAFARAGSSEFGGIRFTGRLAGEPVNTFQGSAQLKAGTECITSGRWGDYFAAALDPAETNKVWIFGEWAENLSGVGPEWDWGTWIGQVGFSTAATRLLSVASTNPVSGVSITVSPNDNNGFNNGTTQFTRTYNNSTTVSLTAPATSGTNSFQKWQRDGLAWSTSRVTTVTMDANHTMTAVYISPIVTRTLTVASSNPNSGAGIVVSPNDRNGFGNGTTLFTRSYNNNTSVTLTAPASASGNTFLKWQRNGVDWSTNRTAGVTMDANHTMTAVYLSPMLVQFATGSQSVTETLNQTTKVNLTVRRTGATSGAASVNYATSNGTASDRSDYLAAYGTLRFAAGEASKVVPVFIIDDRLGEGPQTFFVTLSNPVGCTLGAPSTMTITINSNESVNGANPVKDASFNSDFFVREHYVDFFNREADTSGLAFWKNQIDSCTTPACREIRKINVSAAFFLSIEFQQTGYLVYKTYQAAFNSGESLRLRDFLPDTQEIGRGFVFGQPGADALLEANKQRFFNDFVQRATFLTSYPTTLTATQFVDRLNANTYDPRNSGTGGALSSSQRNALIAQLSPSPSSASLRAQVLRAVAENALFSARQSNKAFVLMQYFGYLRRNPNDAPDNNFSGYNFWLTKLNQFNGNFVNADMVKAFITAGEYQLRFGP